MTEFDRFLTLFDQMALFAEQWLDRTPADKLDWLAVENPSMKFGDRVSRITIKGLVIHIAVGEHHWTEDLASCAAGATIAIPKDPQLEQHMSQGDFRVLARSMHEENMVALRRYDAATLDKRIVFADRQWSVMGFLWAVYAHRAFHLGNIDIYLRQTDTIAPDFFRFPSMTMV